jgi:hypothetical protein
MAKIFRTEELSINGDEIRISAPLNSDDLVFEKTVNGAQVEITTLSSLMLRDLGHDSDISSLAKTNTDGTADLDSDISSLQVQSVNDVEALDSDISSLQVQSDNDVEALDSDISSLQVQSDNDVEALDSDISSLQVQSENNVEALDSDISSLQVQSDNDAEALDSDISSLHVQSDFDVEALDSDISSLAKINTDGTANLDSDISSLQVQSVNDVEALDSDISSLNVLAATNDVRVNNVALAVSDGYSKTVTFSEAFPEGTTPAVVGLMKAGSDDPILGVQLTAVSNTQATFQFSDDIPANDTYTLVVMASA